MENLIVTPYQMKALEEASCDNGVSLSELMDNAGRRLAQNAMEFCARKKHSKNIVILAGNGNNAGDGFVCAEILKSGGYNVSVILCCGEPKTQLAKNAFEKISDGVHVISADKSFSEISESCEMLIDCIFGTGFHGEISSAVADVLDYFNSINAVRIACDVPSGVSAMNGCCSPCVLKCDYTVTFGATKIGTLLFPAREFCGEIIVGDIGIPQKAYQSSEKSITLLDVDYVKNAIPKRSPNSHKGNFGKLLSICGSRNFPGAAALSAMSALRCGVGIFTLASVKSVTQALSSAIFEATYLSLDEDKNGQLVLSDLDEILSASKTASVLLIGCGLGKSAEISELVAKIIENAECPIILDADGINAILDRIDILRNTKASIILTPHPGELARLLDIGTKEVLEKRVELSAKLSREYGVTVVSKGAGTVIACPDGELFVSTTGNAGLSRGGSGDVLAGMIASFAAQKIPPKQAACCGVFLHGLAADKAAQKLSMQGMLPTDLINELPLLFKEIDR